LLTVRLILARRKIDVRALGIRKRPELRLAGLRGSAPPKNLRPSRSIFARTGAGNGCPPPDAGVTVSPAGASPLRCTGPKSNASRSPAARSCAGGPLLARLTTSALRIDAPLHCAGKPSTSVRLPGIAAACVIEPDNDDVDARYPCSILMTTPYPESTSLT
jgi:hypothetical protein